MGSVQYHYLSMYHELLLSRYVRSIHFLALTGAVCVCACVRVFPASSRVPETFSGPSSLLHAR